ncbi:MAG: EamA family transporter [Rhodospirillales bacterium]|nr:EamA family transporter [Rhodospirillales bacterium]
MSPIQIACAVLVPLLWGVQYVVIKTGLAAFPPLFFVGLRFAAVSIVLIPFVGFPTKRELGPFLLISVFIGGLNFGLVFVGLAHGLASVTGVANQLWTPFTLLLAWPLLGERPSMRVIMGVVIAFCGVILTVVDPDVSVPVVPTLFVVGSGLALATGTVLTKRYGPFEPMKLVAWMSLFTVPQVLGASAVFEQGQIASLGAASFESWLAFAYTVFLGGIAGFSLWFWLIARCPVSRVAPFALLQTAFAVAAAVILLREQLTPALVAGAAICVAGVLVTQWRSIASQGEPSVASTPAGKAGS